MVLQIGWAQGTFEVLHDLRDLSIHFMLDLDGTIYQTLDLKDQARHATMYCGAPHLFLLFSLALICMPSIPLRSANPTSIGIEIANIGAYAPGDAAAPFAQWYSTDAQGQTVLRLPPDVQVRCGLLCFALLCFARRRAGDRVVCLRFVCMSV